MITVKFQQEKCINVYWDTFLKYESMALLMPVMHVAFVHVLYHRYLMYNNKRKK